MALTIVQSALALSADGASETNFGPGPSITIGSGGNRALFFTFFGTVATASISSTPAPTITATFNGQSVTMFGYRYHATDRSWLAHGYLPAPPSGAGTLSLTVSSGQFSMLALVDELTDAHQTTTPVVVSGGTSTAAPPATMSGTTTVNGSYLYSVLGGGRRSGAPTSAITCTDGTLSLTDQTGTTDLQSVVGAMAYKSKPTAGADSITLTWTGSFRHERQSVEVFEEIASGGGVSVTTGAGSATTQGQAPDAGAGATAATGTGAVAVQGFAPTASAGADVSAAPGLGAVTVQGFAPTATANVNATPSAGTVTLQGAAPTVTVGGAATADAGKGAVALQGSAPTASAGVTIATGRGTITVQGFAPTVASGAGVSITTGAGALAVQGFAPVAGAGVIAVAGFGAITVQGRAPFAAAGIVSTRRHATIAEAANGGTFPRANGGSIIRG